MDSTLPFTITRLRSQRATIIASQPEKVAVLYLLQERDIGDSTDNLLTSSKISSLTLAPLPPLSSSLSSQSSTSTSSSFPNMDVHNLHLAPLPPQLPVHTTPTTTPTTNHVTSVHDFADEFGIQETSVFAVSTTSEQSDASSRNSVIVSPSNSTDTQQSAIDSLSEQIALHMLQSDSGNYLQKLLLLDHIDQVQQKILKWIDSVDEQIDGRYNFYLINSGNHAIYC